MSIKYYGQPDNFIDPGTITGAMGQIAAQLPDGKLKDILSDPFKFIPIAAIIQKLAGRKFQTGQYRLGERFIRHILSKPISGNQDVPDETVPIAQNFFTIALGVDVNNDEDLMALDSGVDAYFLRPDKTNVPRAAVERAVQIKSYWPMVKDGAWYVPWPLDPIYSIKSNPSTMSYHSNLIDKDMPVELESNTGDSNLGGGLGSTVTESLKKPQTWIFILIAVAVVVGGYFLLKHKK